MVKRVFTVALILVILAFLYNFLTKTPSSLHNRNTIDVKVGMYSYKLEIANTVDQRSLGLSNRDSLCTSCGMIFIFDTEGIYPFWMKDTRIPLDMIWLDKDGRIVDMYSAKPQPDAKLWELKTYPNKTPAKYVIEINEGDFDKNNLKVGDIVFLPKM